MNEYTLFNTSLGACAIAWSGDMVIATHLPEKGDSETIARLATRVTDVAKGNPPPAITQAIAAITALLAGGKTDLSFIVCDFSKLDDFATQVYTLARAIPPGETLTYGAIAAQLGDKLLAQRVGQALGRNPFPIIVPCHRVMGANGRLTGFSANGGVETKLKMLAIEGATIGEVPALFGDLPLAVKRRG